MSGSRRVFARERHTAAKLVVVVISAAGFIAAWAGFGATHDPAASGSASLTPTPTAALDPTRPGTAGGPATPGAAPAPTSRTSRGS